MLKVKKLGLALSSLAFLLANACSSVFTQQVETVGNNSITSETTQNTGVEKKSFKTEAVAVKTVATPLPKASVSCPPPPPPPPIPAEILALIKKENPSLLTVLDSMKTLSFTDFHAKMTALAKQYPKYFKAPPPLPPAGVCPPPPAPPKGVVAPSGAPSAMPGGQPSGMPPCPPPPPKGGVAPSGAPSAMPSGQPSGMPPCLPPPVPSAAPTV